MSDMELEADLEKLFSKLEGWLLQQPETLRVWQADRRVRRRMARTIAALVTTIPTRGVDENTLNRAYRRQPFIRQLVKLMEGEEA